MTQPLERDIQAACLHLLALSGVMAFRVNSGAVTGEHNGKRRFFRFNGARGCSDILGVLPRSGRFLAVEVKRPGGKLTPDQAAFLDRIRAAGGLALVVRSDRELEAALRVEGVLT